MKKTLFLVGLVIAIIIANFTVVRAATGDITLVPSSRQVRPGDTFTVRMHIECDAGINLISGREANDGFLFNYDKSKLELISGEAIKFSNLNEESSSGTILLMGNSTAFKSGDVYELKFKVKSNAPKGNTEISTTQLILTDFDNNETTISPRTAVIEIIGDSTIPVEPADTDTTPSQDTNSTVDTTPSTSTSSTTGKQTDKTTTTKTLPKTGRVAIMGTCLTALVIFTAITFKKLKDYKEVK